MNIFTSFKSLVLAAALLATGSAQAQTVKKATSNIVISKVFYAGTTMAGSTKNYTGGEEYIELHNNGSTTLDLAGLYIGLIESEGSTGAYTAGSITSPAHAVALKQLFQFPTDKVYPIEPYGTVVIAAVAKDHSTEAQNGPDLSTADFEFGGTDTDNPAVPNLDLRYSFNASTKAVNLTNGGDAGIIIFSERNGNNLGYNDADNLVFANGKTTGNQYLKVNAYFSMDAVEILKTKATDGIYAADPARKRIGTQDAGYVPADQKMNKDGYVAYRKTALNTEGKTILYDTDNSTTDFMVSNTIAPRAYNTEADGTTDITVTVPESGYLPFNAERPFFTGNDLHIAYVDGKGAVKSYKGNTIIASNAAYVLVGAPGEHTVKYTDAKRTLSTAGNDYWLSDDDEKYVDGVYTTTVRSRYPLKFVNEKGNVRFVADNVDGNTQTMRIDPATEGRFFMLSTSEVSEIKWVGVTPDDVATGISAPSVVPATRSTGIRYNMAGQRVGESYKGIVIIDGKKHIVR